MNATDELVGTFDEVVENIIRNHVPDEYAPHWANERKCRGCDRFIHVLIEGFPKHQAQVIGDFTRNRLGGR